MSPMLMMLSREVRRVPLDYEPPRNSHGHVQPVFDRFYVDALREWEEEKRRWDAGERPDYFRPEQYPNGIPFEDYHGEMPDPAYYYPGERWPRGAVLGIRMYESVTEGTPISIAHPDTPEGRRTMARELAFHGGGGIADGMTFDDWMRVIDGAYLAKDIHTGEIVGPADVA
jgi:hypothetical protein